MLDTTQLDQGVFRVNMLDAVRTSLLRDGDECNVLVMPTLADFPSDSSLNHIRSGISFAGNLPNTEAPNLIQYSSTFANYLTYGEEVEANWVQPSASVEQLAHEGRFTLIQIQPSAVSIEYFPRDEYSNLLLPTANWVISPNGDVIARGATQPEPYFDFFCDVVISAVDTLAEYIAESERNARESWKRLCRRIIHSSAVSKNGHLSFLLASYRRVCVETAARDQVVHLEVITLAEEHEAPGASAMGQMLLLGGKSWMRMKSRLLNLFSGCLEEVLRFGFIGAGFNFANADAL
jgi:hypothetical protein